MHARLQAIVRVFPYNVESQRAALHRLACSAPGASCLYDAGINIAQEPFSSVSLPTDEPKRATVSVPARPANYVGGRNESVLWQVLEVLLAAGEIDRYQARRPGRNRDDKFWRRIEFVAAKRVNRYHGAATLAAFQAAAIMMLRGDVRV
jgi:hypothetical protein